MVFYLHSSLFRILFFTFLPPMTLIVVASCRICNKIMIQSVWHIVLSKTKLGFHEAKLLQFFMSFKIWWLCFYATGGPAVYVSTFMSKAYLFILLCKREHEWTNASDSRFHCSQKMQRLFLKLGYIKMKCLSFSCDFTMSLFHQRNNNTCLMKGAFN